MHPEKTGRRSSLSPAQKSERWGRYYDVHAGSPPRETLLTALDRFAPETGFAIDLGCGSGLDTFELLRRGWHVLAIDNEPEALARITAGLPPAQAGQLQTQVAAFEAISSLPQAELINASFSLPFCLPKHFEALWQVVLEALPAGGRFAGNLFGERDTWAPKPDMTTHTEAGVRSLFAGFALEQFAEKEWSGTTALGKPKHWHVFSVVARRL